MCIQNVHISIELVRTPLENVEFRRALSYKSLITTMLYTIIRLSNIDLPEVIRLSQIVFVQSRAFSVGDNIDPTPGNSTHSE